MSDRPSNTSFVANHDSREEVRAARVCAEHRGAYEVVSHTGHEWAELTGHFRRTALDRRQLPAVGDWVVLRGQRIEHVLPRSSELLRRAAGKVLEPQVIAANIDIAFIVTSANADFNPRRIERYVTAVRACRVQPVLVVNKIDLGFDLEACLGALEPLGGVLPTAFVSAQEQLGKPELLRWLGPGVTATLIGMSGVGKSSIANWLLGHPALTTLPIRGHDARGRHTTTQRRLLPLPLEGGLLLDTPGMRELGLWGEEGETATTFEDIGALEGTCRFRDCRHEEEPGCAVRGAVERGALDAARLVNFKKLESELASVAGYKSPEAKRAIKERGRRIARMQRERKRGPDGHKLR